jgi:hypothetical protein
METLQQVQTFEEAVLKTVLFWSDKSFRTPLNQNNGDDSLNGGMMFALMNMKSMAAQESVTDDKVEKFEEKLTELLMDSQNDPRYEWTLDVDYDPCQMLSEAADYAGFDSGCFPCKTFTRIEKDHNVTAKYQYGGNFITL